MGNNDAPPHFHKFEEEDSPSACHILVDNRKLTSSPSRDVQPPPSSVASQENGKLSALCLFTPNPLRENVDSLSSTTSPLSSHSPHSPALDLVLPVKSTDCMVASTPDDSPRTPQDGVFDPFAPAPDCLLLAPLSKKLLSDSTKLVARRLNFDDDDDGVPEARDDSKDACTLSDKLFLDTVYGALLEAIVKKQTEEFVARNQSITLQDPPHTPTSPPRLSGITDSCPGAPVKAFSRKSRKINPGFCRKLEF